MELTIDDCMALAARESATEPELRAAVCVAVGQALHHRYEANGYSEAAEVARRDADRILADWHSAKRERSAAQAEAKAARESATREELWRTRTALDECRTARDGAMRERDEARSIAAMRDRALTAAVREREAFGLRASAAERERDEAQAERDAALARPCVGHPTPEERAAHIDAGGEWVMVWREGDGEWLCCSTSEHSNTVADVSYIPARDGLPCAWPVPSAEVTP